MDHKLWSHASTRNENPALQPVVKSLLADLTKSIW
jgi:hypothetical protein